MAKATTARFGTIVVQVETAVAGTFISICGVTKREFNMDKNLNDFEVPDCSAPEAPAWVERVVKSISSGMSLGGVVAKESLPTLMELFMANASRQMRLRFIGFGTGAGTPDLQASGNYHFKSLKLQSDADGLAEITLSLESDGEIVVASVAALP